MKDIEVQAQHVGEALDLSLVVVVGVDAVSGVVEIGVASLGAVIAPRDIALLLRAAAARFGAIEQPPVTTVPVGGGRE